MDQIKTIQLLLEKPHKVKKDTKPKKITNRVVTESKRWKENFSSSDFENTEQLNLLEDINNKKDSSKYRLLQSQIKEKIQNYKGQDTIKNLFDNTKFVDFDWVVRKLIDSKLLCFYCREPFLVWYQQSRDPKQWSLERINNDYGHNKDNIEIACLSCNVRRRCMYHERYVFTKQLVLNKIN